MKRKLQLQTANNRTKRYHDSKNSWISCGLPSSSRRNRRGEGRGDRGESREKGKGENGERRELRSKSTLELTAPTAKSGSRAGLAINGAQRISQRESGKSLSSVLSSSSSLVITVFTRTSTCKSTSSQKTAKDCHPSSLHLKKQVLPHNCRVSGAMYQQVSAYSKSACNGKAKRIPIIAEYASSTPLKVITPEVLFIPNEIDMPNRLHVSHHLQETHECRMNIARDR